MWVTCLYIDKQSRNIGPFKEVHVYCSLPIYQSDINKVILKILINFFFYFELMGFFYFKVEHVELPASYGIKYKDHFKTLQIIHLPSKFVEILS